MYTIELTEDDCKDINFVGHRYCWSSELQNKFVRPGTNKFREIDAWDIKFAFESDTEGGHSMFPMLDSNSELYSKLLKFYCSIV